ncbi:MAG: porin family protein [Lentimicrobiaceae bacterium]|nr:porin family protein [Lentimicrobiaceae bacterium]
MKKLILTTSFLVALFLSSNLFAQLHVGVKGSFNMVNMNEKIDNNKIETNKIKPTFNAGVFAEFAIADEFYLRPELLYSAKGTTSKVKGLLGEEVVTKTSLNYIEIPVYFLYKGGLGSGDLLLGAGPYFAFGLGGKQGNMDVKFKNDVKVGDPVAIYYKPLDIGANIMVGYEFSSKLSAALVAQLGLTDITTKVQGIKPNESTKNIGFGLSLGYRIF